MNLIARGLQRKSYSGLIWISWSSTIALYRQKKFLPKQGGIDEDMRRKKKTHTQASLWLDDHCPMLDYANSEDPQFDLDSYKDQCLGLLQSSM